jgi:phytoene desaturase
MNRPHAIVIGSGFGGLAAAVRLGARGYQVTVLEQADRPGGKARSFEQDGFVFDMGPTVVTVPELFQELWALAGRRFEDDIDLRSIAPLYAIRFDDGTRFDYLGDHDAMVEQIRNIAPEDEEGYERFLELSEDIFKVGYEELSDVPFDSVVDMARVAPKMMKLQSYRTVYGLVSRYVKNEKLRQVLSFHTLLVGGNPFSTTSIYCLISYLEQTTGVHFPMGGTGKLVEGLVSLVEGRGGTVRYNARVDEITLEGRRATGVRLAGGEVIPAAVVVSNADSTWTYRNLLPEHARPHWKNDKIERVDQSMSVFVWYFGTKRRYADVKHHTILLGPRYRELLDDIFERKVLADDFSLYLHRPTATDPSMAPEGCDAFYVLSPVPHLQSGVDWAEKAETYRKSIEAYLSRTVLPGLEDEVVVSQVLTPQDLLDDVLAPLGAAFGLQPVLTQSAYFRPHNRSEDIENLFLVGAGTHPGAGLPGVVSSAKVLDRMVPVPPYAPAREDLRRSDLDSCRAILGRGSRSFSAASHLLPREVREPVTALYAFCRTADDLIDEHGGDDGSVDVLRERLDRIYAGHPIDSAVDRAFTHVVHTHRIPRELPEALIDGFRWDAAGRRYETIEELEEYGARVASTVGVMMTLIMGPRRPGILARAADLGLAMQLTNIARDVGEDARAGRLYLPAAWMREAGLDPDAFLADPSFSPALGEVIERLLDRADRYYRAADEGIAALPASSRVAIRAASLIYQAIGGRIRARGLDSVSARAHTSGIRKLWLVARALWARLWKARSPEEPARPSTQFLVDAVTSPRPAGTSVMLPGAVPGDRSADAVPATAPAA